MTATDHIEACSRFIDHLVERIRVNARGEGRVELESAPSGVFWLGCLAPEDAVVDNRLGERGERLDPCATGFRLLLAPDAPTSCEVTVRFAIWNRADRSSPWHKTPVTPLPFSVDLSTLRPGQTEIGEEAIARAVATASPPAPQRARVDIELRNTTDGHRELTFTLVNCGPKNPGGDADPNIYECDLEVRGLTTQPFLLDALPESFRFDRRVPAYGINGGVSVEGDSIRTVDLPAVDRGRPQYWNSASASPDLRFAELAADPVPAATRLHDALAEWGRSRWSEAALAGRAASEAWTPAMQEEATKAADDFWEEVDRIGRGLKLLTEDAEIARAFCMMNEAMALLAARRQRYDSWRPFQFGFLLANLTAVRDPDADSGTADIVWFATGGGKTETYLGLLLTAAFLDRMTGKLSGTTAWSRFPLRMLSLQQTQRFADALAAAELVRRRHELPGDQFSLGFLVGGAATPNRIPLDPKPGDADPNDDTMPARYRVLTKCPFCGADTRTEFDRRYWRLDHLCTSETCPWPPGPLPFHIVDDEIYRFLPTVVVGTVDKVANVATQASMRGLVAAPHGRCNHAGHGFTYAARAERPHGCLVPGCRGRCVPLDDRTAISIGPSFRLQDELHLLRDSLGAVDSHYEGLLDHLLSATAGRRSKILASSATLTGFERQVDALYQRKGRVFPQPPPSDGDGFWTAETAELNRRFIAVAPRGATLEYAIDRILSDLQAAVRELVADPESTKAFGVDPSLAPFLVDLYGVDVVYGNTLRDLDAVVRSTDTQLRVDGMVNTAMLTGGTEFEAVRAVLDRLEDPEPGFEDRVHVVAASSMMSHGVDIDRLNVMAVYGLPLATAEFIQATARVGRRWPGLVLVIHKIARERDAGIYRNFAPFVRHGDRFVEAVPVTRHSRRVLERTLPGVALARLWQIIEPDAHRSLATTRALAEYHRDIGLDRDAEVAAVVEALGLTGSLDDTLRTAIENWMQDLFENIATPPPNARFPSELLPRSGRPMRSLRDVEEQVPVIGLAGR